MKRIGLLIGLIGLLWSGFCSGQVYVDGFMIDTLSTSYCQLICANATIFTRTKVSIDYGQPYVSHQLSRQKIAGPDKQVISFNSTIDALNFMNKQGWELVSFQVTSKESGSEDVFVYLLQRRKKISQKE